MKSQNYSVAHPSADSGESVGVGSASSPTGSLVVRTTEQGLPISVHIDDSEMRRAPAELADRVLRVCRQSAAAAGYRRRQAMAADGVAPDILDALHLPTASHVSAQEFVDDDGDEDGPATWLRTR